MGPPLQEVWTQTRRKAAIPLHQMREGTGEESTPVLVRAFMEEGSENGEGNRQVQEMRYHPEPSPPIFIGQYWLIGKDRRDDKDEWAITYLPDGKAFFVAQEAMDELLAHMRGQYVGGEKRGNV